MSLVVNGLPASSMFWFASWSGVWVADIELNGDAVPFGRALIASTEGIAANGTIDPDHTGTFGEKRHARVIGGGGGWSKRVRPQHYQSDVGLPLAVVASTTAAEVGEVVTVLTPMVVGTDYVRVQDDSIRASQIFEDAGVDWWVGLDGITKVGVRPPLPPHPSLQVLDWNPDAGTMSFTCEVLVEPGTVLVDPRFGSRVVREVEATVSGGSVSGTFWVTQERPEAGTAGELVDNLGAIACAATRAKFMRFYEYRVIAMADVRVLLQAIRTSVDGVPDILPVSIWAGVSGYRASLRLSSHVLVGFRAGDPTKPFVAFYEPPERDGWRPMELELDAIAKLTVGEQAAIVQIGAAAGAQPVARAPAIATYATALAEAITTAAATANGLGAPLSGAQLSGLLTTMAESFSSAAGALATGCPSAKAVAS